MSSGKIGIIPTIVPATLHDVEEASERYAGFASFFQIDVADGVFAPNSTWLPSAGDMLPKEYSYEVHLMVAEPRGIGLSFAHAGAHTLIGHLEAFGSAESAKRAIGEWKAAGVQSVGVAVLFQTSLEDVEPYLPFVDFVQLMTIARIGVQGIPYDSRAPARVAQFRERHPTVTIAVDGGVSEKNIEELARAGATRFGVGSAIAKAVDPAAMYERLGAMAQSASA